MYIKFDNLDEMGKSLEDENYQSLLKKKYLTWLALCLTNKLIFI